MKKKELEKNRNYMIAKRNDLIQKSRYSLSVVEQKIVWLLISKIEPDDGEFKKYEFDLHDFCQLCGIQEANGKNYKNLKSAIDKLTGRSFWMYLNSTYEQQIKWIENPAIDHEKKVLILQLNPLLKPFLLNLKAQGGYSLLEYPMTLIMQSKYSIRLYEMLKSLSLLGEYTYELNDLKRKINAEKYERFPDFKRRVLDISMLEINMFADFLVEAILIKTGRAYTHIKFVFTPKDGIQHYDTSKLIEKRLETVENQLTF